MAPACVEVITRDEQEPDSRLPPANEPVEDEDDREESKELKGAKEHGGVLPRTRL